MTREEIVAQARTWLGVPFRHQGRTRKGVDCVGLLVCVGSELGLEVDDNRTYTRRAAGLNFLEPFRAQMNEIRVLTAELADALIFVQETRPCHVAIRSERHGVPHIIHAHGLRGLVLEEPFTDEWRRQLRFAFTWPAGVVA